MFAVSSYFIIYAYYKRSNNVTHQLFLTSMPSHYFQKYMTYWRKNRRNKSILAPRANAEGFAHFNVNQTANRFAFLNYNIMFGSKSPIFLEKFTHFLCQNKTQKYNIL